MGMTNNVNFIGRLTKDIDLKQVGETTLGRFTIAIDRGKKKNGEDAGTDFIPCQAWGNLAHNIAKYSGKGLRIAFSGRVRTDSYDKEGKTVYTTDFVAEEVKFIDFKDANGKAPGQDTQAAPAAAPAAPAPAAPAAPAASGPQDTSFRSAPIDPESEPW